MFKFFARRSDLPLDRDAHSQFLPWLIAFMVFLAVLAMAGMLMLNAVAERWDQGVTGTLTVQIAPSEDPSEDDIRLRNALTILASTKAIDRYEVMSDARVLKLLEPWLGGIANSDELPLPRLIDVELHSGADLDAAQLTERLAARVPGSSVDDHRVWLERLVSLIRTVQTLATMVLFFIAMATVGTVIFTTRTGLAIHREAIEVLHLIGAQDSYIARQFARRALALGLTGGLLGLVLGIPTLMAIGYLVGRMDGFLLPSLHLAGYHWILVGLLPVGVALIAMITARTTVLRSLAKML
ncbi:MAG: cell division protein [Rhodospirillales bacterium]|nr:cell division protein [Rhodospirillales bacterium]